MRSCGSAIGTRRSRPGFLYLPYAQPATAYRSADVSFLTRVNVVVRHAGAPQAAAVTLSQTLRSLEATAPVVRVESMEAAIASTVVDRRFHLLALGGFASVALALALIDVYGVTSIHVGRRPPLRRPRRPAFQSVGQGLRGGRCG